VCQPRSERTAADNAVVQQRMRTEEEIATLTGPRSWPQRERRVRWHDLFPGARKPHVSFVVCARTPVCAQAKPPGAEAPEPGLAVRAEAPLSPANRCATARRAETAWLISARQRSIPTAVSHRRPLRVQLLT
jgi:hypothetical protein